MTEQRTYHGTTIQIAVPTNSEYWTHDSEDEAMLDTLLTNYSAAVLLLIRRDYPEAAVSVRLVPETFSRGNRTEVCLIGGDILEEDALREALDRRIQAFPVADEELWETPPEDFDPTRYLRRMSLIA